VRAGAGEHAARDAVALAQDAEQQVRRLDAVVAEFERLAQRRARPG
jgi:hypothetical protein